MSLVSHLSQFAGAAFAELGFAAELGEVVPSQRPELAQFQCNGAMSAAKSVARPPIEIAAEVASLLETDGEIARVEVAPPGFINLTLTDQALARWAGVSAGDAHLGYRDTATPETVVVDYAGPNVSKAMHVGHLRATIIGDSLARLLAFAGHTVIRDPHFGDWGFNMGLLIAAIEEAQPDLPYFTGAGSSTLEGVTSSGTGVVTAPEAPEFPETSPVSLDDLERLYPKAAARARDDTAFADAAREATVRLQQGDAGYLALWRHMKSASEEAQREDFAALGVNFDLWYGESDVRDRIAPMVATLIESGVSEESDGAVVIRVAEEADKRDIPPLILESSVGGALYGTTDLATIEMRVEELHADLMLYVVDKRQADHFVQLFRAAYKAGMIPEGTSLEHIWFGTMNGPDGKPFKTREGGVVRLADVIEMLTEAARRRLDEAHLAEDYPAEERERIASLVGVAALKFGDLINNRVSDYVFDLDRFSSFEGKTGPYLQYAAVRIKSILRKADEAGLNQGEISPPEVDVERDLLLDLLRFPEVVQRAIDLRSPNHVAEFAYGVAGRFNRFYDTCHILSEVDPIRQASWLALSAWALRALERLLDLLGIEIPERM